MRMLVVVMGHDTGCQITVTAMPYDLMLPSGDNVTKFT